MTRPAKKPIIRLRTSLITCSVYSWRKSLNYWQKNWWHKALCLLLVLTVLTTLIIQAIGLWYIKSEKSKPLELGATFIPGYAEYLGLDPHQTMSALINDVGVRRFRLVSYWNDIEPAQGQYDFSMLDWEFQQADQAHAKITLAIGLRQPRWPECHPPSWVNANEPWQQWYPALSAYMTAVVDRYKNNPALDSYQLENEYLNKTFGQCTDYSHERLVDEFRLVKQLDPTHPVIISRSNNLLFSIELNGQLPDEAGVSIYRRVWDSTVTSRYLEYPYQTIYFSSIAGLQKIATGRDSMVHELQEEPWPPDGKGLFDTSLAEQNKSFNAARFNQNLDYAKATGMRTIDLWGSEYWYYRKVKLHDPSVWNAAKQAFRGQQ